MKKDYKAKLNNVRISPRKLKLVVDLVRGMAVEEALDQLKFLPKKGAIYVEKVVKSAAANAKDLDKVKSKDLVISEIFVTASLTYKRGTAVSRGRYHRILKRGSNINLKLTEK